MARRFVQAALIALDQDDLAWTASLLVSELVTNAALHARTDITVAVTAERDGPVRLEVRDGSGRLPRRRAYGADATTGRGLRLIADLAARWGIEPVGGGKTVWVELDRPDGAAVEDSTEDAEQLAAQWLATADDDHASAATVHASWPAPRSPLAFAAA